MVDAMTFKSITFHRAATVNLGNFNSTKIELGATVELQPGETEEQAFERLSKWVNDKVREQVKNPS